ncbi:MAG: protein kinase [bacterium]|nr:protein kinase [bacterium]
MDNILLVEANEKHAETLRMHLEKHHFAVNISGTIQQAKTILEKEKTDACIIDLNITQSEDERFSDFYRWLLETPGISTIPRLFITGKTYQGFSKHLTEGYGETVLPKPLDVTKLTAELHRLKGKQTINLSAQEDDYLSSYLGKRVGSAVIQKEIARGGMGAVFLGYQESLNRQVAVKVLLPSLVGDAATIERFQREARATAQLKSPHIVQIYDFGKVAETGFYITMEYLPGETVEHYLNRNGRFPLEKAVSVIAQVAMGLTSAHDAQLIHRDIKPSNLIMNNAGHVTITDFGLVRPQKKVQQTQAGMVVGTPQYLPPEQASNTPMDSRADIYSLGIVFYQLVVGKLPFVSNNPMELLMKHLNESLPDPRDTIPEIPQRVVEIINRMTAKDRNKRYISCRELLWDLESFEKKPAAQPPAAQPPAFNSATKAFGSIRLDNSLNREFNELQSRFPSLFTMDKLQGVMTLSESGAMVNCQGNCPEEWRNSLYILHESTKELNAAAQLGAWQFKIIDTPGNIVAQFPTGNQLAALRFEQTDTAAFSASTIKGHTTSFRKIEKHSDPILQTASIAGVIDVMLFAPGGRLVQHNLKNPAALEQYTLRFPPAVQVIHSISFEMNTVDIWFEKGRILLWRLEKCLLLVVGTLDVSRSFLSIFISSHLDELNRTAMGQIITQPLEEPPKEVEHPVSPALMDKIQLELARAIGPIAKILISKETKAMGYSVGRFPHQQLDPLVKRLTAKIDPSKKEQFSEKVQDLLYEAKSDKEIMK